MTNPVALNEIPAAPRAPLKYEIEGDLDLNFKMLKTSSYKNAAVQEKIKDISNPSIWTRVSNVASLIAKAVGKFFKAIANLFAKEDLAKVKKNQELNANAVSVKKALATEIETAKHDLAAKIKANKNDIVGPMTQAVSMNQAWYEKVANSLSSYLVG